MMDVQAEHVSLEGRVDAAAEHSLTWLGRTGNTACCRRRRRPAAISVLETRSGSIQQSNKARGLHVYYPLRQSPTAMFHLAAGISIGEGPLQKLKLRQELQLPSDIFNMVLAHVSRTRNNMRCQWNSTSYF